MHSFIFSIYLLLFYDKIDKVMHMGLRIGDVNQMVVNRKTDIGYMLDSGLDQVFLHNNESLHQELKAGDAVEAFLYYDNKGRLAATLKKPYITVSKPGFLQVTDVNEDIGVFLDMGIAKDLLLSYEDLPRDIQSWPQVGDKLYITIKVKGKLVGKIAAKQDIQIHPEEDLPLMQTQEGYVQKIGQAGINILTEAGHFIFVHHSMIDQKLRYGQKVNVKVTFLSDKGYTGSLKDQKEVKRFDDANEILSYLIRHHEMPLTSDSTPEEIEHYFNMSKKAFKRALGNLYKERKVVFEDGKTVLVKS
jgi:predicted RNA-binding protein (virulence factor B family)